MIKREAGDIMKQQSTAIFKPVDRNKLVIIAVLFFIAAAITLSGGYFIVYSLLNHISIQVLNTNVPGVVFGIIVAYLGFRYLLSVFKLKAQLFTSDTQFPWQNFKKNSTAKNR